MGMGPRQLSDPRFLIVIRDLEKGSILTQLDLSTVMGTSTHPEKWFTDQQLPVVLGSRLRLRMRRGEKLTYDSIEINKKGQVFADQIPRGYRAYSFIPENDLPLQIGDSVDVMTQSSDDKRVTRRAASDLEILDLKRGSSVSTLVVAVPELQLAELEKARQSGKLVVVLRGSKEKGLKKKSRLEKQLTKAKIQILVEGEP